jgi:hypothetical protein
LPFLRNQNKFVGEFVGTARTWATQLRS